MGARRLCFWLGVGGVSILANVGLEVAAEYWPNSAFSQLVAYTHRGANR